ncbi:MAG: tRNA pseudouridine(55) synthase TruB [Alphaproteobacteria bacterium]
MSDEEGLRKITRLSIVSGWVILNKPLGLSSTQSTSKVKRLFGATKAGHAGTLDPLATGVLPIALGEATKTMPYAVFTNKTYQFQICWGEERDTGDAEGKVIAESQHRPSAQDIEAVLPQFHGEITQIPPDYSAIKIQGIPAYRLARQGEAVPVRPRQVTIHNLKLLSIDDRDHASFEVSCAVGTYVRSLARDLALALGTKGYLSQLIRTRVGKFTLDSAISLEKLCNMHHKEEWWSVLLTPSAVLDDIPAVTLAASDILKIQRGQDVPVDCQEQAAVSLWADGRLLAIAYVKAGRAHPKRVFHLTEED